MPKKKETILKKKKDAKPATSHKKDRKLKYFQSKTRIKKPYKDSEGKHVPGVTTVTGILDKPALVYWSWDLGRQGIDYRTHRDALADVGKLAHEMVLASFLGLEVDFYEFSPWVVDRAKVSFGKFEQFLKKHKLKPKKVEWEIVSDKMKYGGRMDFFGLCDGVPTIIDFKTGKRIYDDYFFQLGGYGLLLAEENELVEQHMILNIPRDEKESYQMAIRKSIMTEKIIFRNCLDIYHERKKIKAEDMTVSL